MEDKKTNDTKPTSVTEVQDLGRDFWDTQYKNNNTGWDLGEVSPPIKNYIDQLTDKNIRVLIPGCGNTYEAEYLLNKGFTNITVIDISPTLVEKLQHKFSGNSSVSIILDDFFKHKGEYDLILEQTFFCAIHPSLRKNYAEKAHELLSKNGKIVGLIFDKEFGFQGPPFGGSKSEYKILFEKLFTLKTFEECTNSFHKRAGTELFIQLIKK